MRCRQVEELTEHPDHEAQREDAQLAVLARGHTPVSAAVRPTSTHTAGMNATVATIDCQSTVGVHR